MISTLRSLASSRTRLRAGAWLRSLAQADGWPSIPGLAPGNHERTQHHRAIAGALVAVLGAFGFMHGSSVYRENIDEASFYQSYFAPAVNLACSGRFTHFEVGEEAAQFLNSRTGTLEDCSGVADAETTERWTPFNNQSTYLMWLTALVWNLTSVSWENLHILAGIVTAFFAVSVFVFLRVFAPSTVLSFLVAVLVLYSPLAAAHIPDLRDFAKAPFILAPLGLIGIATTRNLSASAIVALFGGAGLILGVGGGFRPDSAVVIPLAVVSIALLLLTMKPKRALAIGGASLAALFAAYFIAHLPVGISKILRPEVASLTSHFFSLGFAEIFFEQELRMNSSSVTALRLYEDSFLHDNISAYAGAMGELGLYSPEYDRAGWSYFFEMARHYPYDLFLRPFFAVKILMGYLPDWFAYIGAFSLAILGLSGVAAPRIALFFMLSFLTLTAIATLQFHVRHYFYLTAFWPALALLGVSGLWRVAVRPITFFLPNPDRPAKLAFAGTVLGLTVFIAAGSVFLPRVQAAQIADLIEERAGLDWRPALFTMEGGLLRIPSLPDDGMYFARIGFEEGSASLFRISPGAIRAFQDSAQVEARSGDAVLRMGEPVGYQFEAGPFDVEDFRDGSGVPRILVRAEIVNNGAPVSIGVIAGDYSRWLGVSRPLESGAHEVIIEPNIPEGIETFRILFEKRSGEPGEAVVRNLEIGQADQVCLPSEARVVHLYQQRTADYPSFPERLPASVEQVYSFPISNEGYMTFIGLDVSQRSAACVASVMIAPFPPGHLGSELVEASGEAVPPLHRGSLIEILGELLTADGTGR